MPKKLEQHSGHGNRTTASKLPLASASTSAGVAELAAIPVEDFEETASRKGSIPTTQGAIQHHFPPPTYVPTQDGDASRLSSLLRELEQMVQRCPKAMRGEVSGLDIRRVAPSLVRWLGEPMN
jgi:hypothetical protein